MTTFYLGAHHPHWLRLLDVPLFVSRNALARPGRRLPRAVTSWALDSGGFSELKHYGGWRIDAATYAAEVRRYRDEIGMLEWAAPMDMMCEPFMLAKTGLTVAEHQGRTVVNYLELRDLAPDLPIRPVLQGWTLDDYLRCADMYEMAGVDLTAEPLVGVGSVCRRQHASEIAQIVGSLAARGLRLHGFGVKTLGLGIYARHLVSADSMAWSFRGRHVGPCVHGRPAKNEANCRAFALEWRERVLTVIGATDGG